MAESLNDQQLHVCNEHDWSGMWLLVAGCAMQQQRCCKVLGHTNLPDDHVCCVWVTVEVELGPCACVLVVSFISSHDHQMLHYNVRQHQTECILTAVH